MDFFQNRILLKFWGYSWVIYVWKNLKEEIENKIKSENQELLRQLREKIFSLNCRALKLALAEIVKKVFQSHWSVR